MAGMLKYFGTIMKHKWFVFLACRKLGGIPLWRAIIHDLSKFTPVEYSAYKDRVLNGGEVTDRRKWGYAWLHHQNHNPHHWEYWMFYWQGDPKFYDGIVINGCLEMPETYIREMIADWLGASRLYTGSWDMGEWLEGNLPKMVYHPASEIKVMLILSELGYRYEYV